MIRRSALPLAVLVCVLSACAHAPARSGSPEALAPSTTAAPSPEPLAQVEPPAEPAAEPAPPSPPAAEPAAVRPVQTLELKLVKTFPGAVAPKSVALSPDGRWAAVMNLEGMDVWLIDTQSLEIVRRLDFAPFREAAAGWDYAKKKPIPSFAQKPVEAVFSADSRHLWFSLHNAASVVVYDLEEKDELPAAAPSYRAVVHDAEDATHVWRLPRIRTGKTPKVVEMTPDGRRVVIANWHSGSITVVDTATLEPVATIQSGASPGFVPRGLAVSADSGTVYVANMGGGTISTIDLNALKKVREDAITRNPRHLALSRDGRILYVSENAGGEVLKYDLIDQKILARSAVGSQARTIALSPDERLLFAVSNEDGKIVALRAGDLSHLYDAPFTAPMGVAVSPDGRRIWVTSYTGAGYVSVFDVVIDADVPVAQARPAVPGS
jgi:YVTN family beta-propeller protein